MRSAPPLPFPPKSVDTDKIDLAQGPRGYSTTSVQEGQQHASTHREYGTLAAVASLSATRTPVAGDAKHMPPRRTLRPADETATPEKMLTDPNQSLPSLPLPPVGSDSDDGVTRVETTIEIETAKLGESSGRGSAATTPARPSLGRTALNWVQFLPAHMMQQFVFGTFLQYFTRKMVKAAVVEAMTHSGEKEGTRNEHVAAITLMSCLALMSISWKVLRHVRESRHLDVAAIAAYDIDPEVWKAKDDAEKAKDIFRYKCMSYRHSIIQGGLLGTGVNVAMTGLALVKGDIAVAASHVSTEAESIWFSAWRDPSHKTFQAVGTKMMDGLPGTTTGHLCSMEVAASGLVYGMLQAAFGFAADQMLNHFLPGRGKAATIFISASTLAFVNWMIESMDFDNVYAIDAHGEGALQAWDPKFTARLSNLERSLDLSSVRHDFLNPFLAVVNASTAIAAWRGKDDFKSQTLTGNFVALAMGFLAYQSTVPLQSAIPAVNAHRASLLDPEMAPTELPGHRVEESPGNDERLQIPTVLVRQPTEDIFDDGNLVVQPQPSSSSAVYRLSAERGSHGMGETH